MTTVTRFTKYGAAFGLAHSGPGLIITIRSIGRDDTRTTVELSERDAEALAIGILHALKARPGRRATVTGTMKETANGD